MSEVFLHGPEVVEIDKGIRPIRTASSSVIGVIGTAPDADPAVFPLNEPVLITKRTEAAKLLTSNTLVGAEGTLPMAMDGIFDQAGAVTVVIRVAEGVDENETLANVAGGVDPNTEKQTGVQALLGAESKVGACPRLLCAPGWTHQSVLDTGNYLKNPVVAEMEGVAEQLRATIIADGQNDTDATVKNYRKNYATRRVYLIDPWGKVMKSDGSIAEEPLSARVAGVISRIDNTKGFWHSPSNQPINGIIGLSRPIDFGLGDPTSRANLLNEKEVSTVIRYKGFRLWGNRTCSGDPKWAFLSVARTADMLNQSLLENHLWAVDKNITRSYFQQVAQGVQQYIDTLVAKGALLGGSCFPTPDLNNEGTISKGEAYWDFEFTPPFPCENPTFRSILTTKYIKEIL